MRPPTMTRTSTGSWYDVGIKVVATLYFAATLERFVHRHLVGVFEIAADRHAHRDARDAHAQRLEQPRKIQRGRLAFDVRIGGQNDLFDLSLAHSGEQALDFQLVGTDPLQRRQRAHQHVIDALEVARLLDGRDVLWLFD